MVLACHFDSAYFQCVLIKTDVGLAPEAAFAAAVPACVPFALPFGLDDSAVCPCCPPASAADLLSPDRPWAALGGLGRQWQQTRSFAVDTACCRQQRRNQDRPTPAGFPPARPPTRSSVAAAGQTTLLSSDRPGLQHRYNVGHNVVGGDVCPGAGLSNPTCDQTGSQGSRAASGNDNKQTGSGSSMSSGANRSFQTATMMESRRESLSYTICETKPLQHQKYPSRFFNSMEAAWSLSIALPCRSGTLTCCSSSMISSMVSASERTAPVSGKQPRVRKRTVWY